MLPKIHCCTSKIPVSFSSAQPSCAPFIRRPPGSSTARPAVAAALQFLDDTRLVRRRNLGRAVRRRPGPNGRSAGSMTWAGLLNTLLDRSAKTRRRGVHEPGPPVCRQAGACALPPLRARRLRRGEGGLTSPRIYFAAGIGHAGGRAAATRRLRRRSGAHAQ